MAFNVFSIIVLIVDLAITVKSQSPEIFYPFFHEWLSPKNSSLRYFYLHIL